MAILLIFDEILTFRTDVGGVQAAIGVTPDLTSIAKFIGGGLPLGAFGGREEVMAPFDPTHAQTIPHNGTFNGNNITMAAGIATMKEYGADEVARINRLGQRLKEGFNRAFETEGVNLRAVGEGSIIRVHWSEKRIRNAREGALAQAAAQELPRLLHMELMNRDIFSAPRCQFAISTPMTKREVDTAIEAMACALEVVMPYIAEETPHLLRA